MISGQSGAKYQSLFISEAAAKNHRNENLDKKYGFHLSFLKSTTHVTSCFPSTTVFFRTFLGRHTKASEAIQD